MSNRAQRRAAKRAGKQPEQQVIPTPRLTADEQEEVVAVFAAITSMSDPDYVAAKHEDPLAATMKTAIEAMSDDQLIVFSSTGTAAQQIAAAHMQERLTRSLAAALLEKIQEDAR